MAAREVRAVAFDVNETLFSLDQLPPAFAAIGVDPAAVPLWFARPRPDHRGHGAARAGPVRPTVNATNGPCDSRHRQC
jgi:hypothetical protein